MLEDEVLEVGDLSYGCGAVISLIAGVVGVALVVALLVWVFNN